MNSRPRLLISLIVLAAHACGGGGGGARQATSSRSGLPAGPADIPAMRALLERYSPTGTWIVRMYETMPREFKFGTSSITLSDSGDFGSYFDDGAPENVVGYMSTAVHEVYHGMTHRLGYKLLADEGAKEIVDGEGFYDGGAPMRIRYTPIYPAREMVATYPSDARAFRFDTYVDTANAAQSTQSQGAFGLLDEWMAYMHDARIYLDFWPWIRDEAPRTTQVYTRYRSRLQDVVVPHAEFKLFLLHYLVHARQHRPEVYRGLMTNDSFRRAFVAADNAWNRVLADAAALEPSIDSIAAARGAAGISYGLDAAYPRLQAYLAGEPYVSMLAELRGGRQVAVTARSHYARGERGP